MTRFIARFVLFAVVFCAGMFVFGAAAKPSDVQEFLGDRWLMAQGASADDVTRAMRCPPQLGCRKPFKRKKWKPPHRQPDPGVVSPIIKKVIVIPVPRARPDDAPEPDEDEAVFNGAWNTIAVALNTLEAPRVLRLVPSQPLNIFEGFAREIMRAVPGRSERLLAGVTPKLAAMTRTLIGSCGGHVISGVRRTYVRGSGRRSLHWEGRAVDIGSPNPRCLYAILRKHRWSGGASIDYAAVRHLHLSYGGREHGRRFVHYRGGYKRTRNARARTMGRMASR